MGRIGIQTRMPQHGNSEGRHRDRKRESVQSPARRLPVWRSGTVAIRSEPRARASAVEKPLTIVAISRSSPSASRASSTGPFSSPRRETRMCLPAA